MHEYAITPIQFFMARELLNVMGSASHQTAQIELRNITALNVEATSSGGYTALFGYTALIFVAVGLGGNAKRRKGKRPRVAVTAMALAFHIREPYQLRPYKHQGFLNLNRTSCFLTWT